ncbi:MAG: rane protein [Candidatus Petromonas sp.]|jgi:membrane protein|nr:rane protein [Candidatus Petromonas sp.]
MNDSFFSFFIREIKDRFEFHNINAYGAQIAYFFLLSLFPFLIFLIAVLSQLSMSPQGAIDLFAKVAPNEVITVIDDYIKELIPSRSINLLSISFFATIWSASRGLNALIILLNRAYGIKKERNFIMKRVLAIFFTLLVAISIVLVLTIPSMGMNFLLWISRYIGLTDFFISVWYYLRWIVIIAILFSVMGSLYYIAPNKKLKFLEIIPGTLFAICGWILISLGFSFFVNNFRNFTIIYGSLAAIIVLMIWLYLSGIMLVLGGEINSIYSSYIVSKSKDKSMSHSDS